ncbi:MAG: DUF6794 domain-containing protein [Planctomycetota bacterium]|jgi:hypothetical protein
MRRLVCLFIVLALCFLGCGRKEEPDVGDQTAVSSPEEPARVVVNANQSNHSETGKKQSGSEDEWPRTVEAATTRLLAILSDKDKEVVRNTAEEDLIGFHHGWGMGIRNEFGLWQGNDALLKSCGKQHPDDASMVIIRSVWRELRENQSSEQGAEGDAVNGAP